MTFNRRNFFYSESKLGLLRIMLQDSPATKETIVWFIPVCSLAIFFVSCCLLIVLPLISKHHTVEYGHMVGGNGKNVNSLLDGRVFVKIVKELEKLEFEGKIGSKKNQRLLEAVDKNERRNVFHTFFYFVMTWIPSNFLILFFIRLENSIRRMIVRKYILVKCVKHVVMNFINLCAEALSRTREFL